MLLLYHYITENNVTEMLHEISTYSLLAVRTRKGRNNGDPTLIDKVGL